MINIFFFTILKSNVKKKETLFKSIRNRIFFCKRLKLKSGIISLRKETFVVWFLQYFNDGSSYIPYNNLYPLGYYRVRYPRRFLYWWNYTENSWQQYAFHFAGCLEMNKKTLRRVDALYSWEYFVVCWAKKKKKMPTRSPPQLFFPPFYEYTEDK